METQRCSQSPVKHLRWSFWFSVVNCFRKKRHLRCLTGFWIFFWNVLSRSRLSLGLFLLLTLNVFVGNLCWSYVKISILMVLKGKYFAREIVNLVTLHKKCYYLRILIFVGNLIPHEIDFETFLKESSIYWFYLLKKHEYMPNKSNW